MQRVSQLKISKDTRKMPKVYFDLHVTEKMYSKISQIGTLIVRNTRLLN